MSKFSQSLFSSVRKTKNVMDFFSRHLLFVNFGLFLMATTIAFSFVLQTNFSAADGYKIRELENAINNLELNNQALASRIAETKSMENVATKVPMLGMVKAETPQYVSDGPDAVSLNR